LKRLPNALMIAIATVFGLTAIAAAPTSAAQGNTGNLAQSSTNAAATIAQASEPDFGSPPSGQIPILYNDRHVYSKPDTLRSGRVLSALVRGGTILIPLRSMFEQMGATVNYDASTKTVRVSKPGSEIALKVGQPSVTINGESRPLDVPPMAYQGVILVPVRVISEAMGAYVQWVPDKQVVVVRYNPAPVATPPPPPPPPAPPPATPAPTPTPTPTPAPTRAYEGYVAGDYLIAPKVYDEFSPGNTGKNSYALKAAFEFPLFGLPWMISGRYDQINYPHNASGAYPTSGSVASALIASGTPSNPGTLSCPAPGDAGCVTTIGGNGSTWVGPFTPQTQTYEGHFGLRILEPRIYLAAGYLERLNNFGYPNVSGVGGGIEKLPDLDKPISVGASAFYYPQLKGNYVDGLGNSYSLQYRALVYDGSITFSLNGLEKRIPLFLEVGYHGESDNNKQNAPINRNENGAYAGLGFKFF
jgi:hypothetical protein